MENVNEKSTQTHEAKLTKWKQRHGFTNFTLKDALQMVLAGLVPLTIGILTVIIMRNTTNVNQDNRKNDLEIAQQRRLSDERQALELGNETVLSQFITDISDIILKVLTNPYQGASAHYGIIRGLIVTVFQRLDLRRTKIAIRYLLSTGMLKRGVGPFGTGYLHSSEMHLKEVNLNNINFNDLQLTKLLLKNTSLINASFVNSNIAYADFTGSILIGANFSGAILDGAKFLDTQLQETDFTRTSVYNIQLDRTNLNRSSITNEQIAQALIIYKTILPNGTYSQNKTIQVNGDGKQGTFGWNITYGNIQVKSSSFTSNQNASMVQIIDLTTLAIAGLPEYVYSCISFQFYRGENLKYSISEFGSYYGAWNSWTPISDLPSSSIGNSSNSDGFQYWYRCPWSPLNGGYLFLQFIFNFLNVTTNETDFPAVKDIQVTIIG
ncbi:hypothetical protein I4U23_027201 [Adineta vaga]|nr:hypothetical protein I4U23_027201 [Adineta vaga]